MTHPHRAQHLYSGALAFLVHGVFLLALVFGVSWKVQPALPVEADLWAALPPLPRLPEPPPAPAPEAEPDLREAEIALEKARKVQERKEALQRQAEEKTRLERERQEKLRQELAEKEKQRRELARQQVEKDLARQMQEDLSNEETQLKALRDQARRGQDARQIRDAQARIKAKIISYVRLPQTLFGNPEAVFQVTLLPNGEVLKATLVKSSGQSAYDIEVERAILRASPLPLPTDRGAAAAFRDGLILKFRPREDG
ncbi:MAG: TonB family protein [Betaproteobacteria bacterium]|nr:TonB family protein [Betaproteobacteria bacterium]